MKFLRIKRTDTGQTIIVPMKKELLATGGAISPRLLWSASAGRKSRVFNLGIAGSAMKVDTGHPWIGSSGKSGYGGWGFGGIWGDPDTRILTWQGIVIRDVTIEIAVKSTALTKDEILRVMR